MALQNQEQKQGGTYRRILYGSGVYAVAVFAGRMASFLLLPVYTRFLTPADYGVLELLDLTLFVFGALVGMRIGDALIYRWAKTAGDEAARVGALSTAYWGAVGVGLTSFGLGWILAPLLSRLVFGGEEFAGAFRLMFGSFACSLPSEVGLSFARARDKSQHYVAFSLARLALTASLNIFFLVVLHWKVEAMLWGGLLGSLAISAASGVYILGQGYGLGRVKWVEMKRLMAYGTPLGVGGLGFLVIHYGDRYFLRHYATLADIGIYSLAYKIGMLVTYLQTPFDVYWRAQMFEIVKKPDGERVYVRVCTYLALGLMTFMVFLLAFSKPILRVMAGPSFGDAARYVPVVAFAYVIRTVGSHFRSVFLLEGKTQSDAAIVWTGALVCLVGYAVLIPKLLVWGAVLATALAFVVMFVVSLRQAQKLRWFDFEFRRMGLILLAAAPAAVVTALYQPEELWLQIAVGLGQMASYGLLLLALRFFDQEETRQAVWLASVARDRARGWLGAGAQ